MKKLIVLCSMFLLVSGMFGTASAVTINYGSQVSGDGTLTTLYDWATVETFDNNSLLWAWEGDGQIVSGYASGQYAAPCPDETKYVSVPTSSSSGFYAAKLGATYNYFGLFWGSVDTYNTLSFFNEGVEVASFTGSDITGTNPANGNQTAPYSNLYVNFIGLADFDSFIMESTNYAFEADNIAVGNAPVPEPSTILLMGAGLLGLVGYNRRRFSKKS